MDHLSYTLKGILSLSYPPVNMPGIVWMIVLLLTGWLGWEHCNYQDSFGWIKWIIWKKITFETFNHDHRGASSEMILWFVFSHKTVWRVNSTDSSTDTIVWLSLASDQINFRSKTKCLGVMYCILLDYRWWHDLQANRKKGNTHPVLAKLVQ